MQNMQASPGLSVPQLGATYAHPLAMHSVGLIRDTSTRLFDWASNYQAYLRIYVPQALSPLKTFYDQTLHNNKAYQPSRYQEATSIMTRSATLRSSLPSTSHRSHNMERPNILQLKWRGIECLRNNKIDSTS
jgi:hypothetical protein